MEGTPESTADRRSHPAQRRAGVHWLRAVPDEVEATRAGVERAPAGVGQGGVKRGGIKRGGVNRGGVPWTGVPWTGVRWPGAPWGSVSWGGPAAPVMGALFGALTGARGARVFHPRGSAYHAEVFITPAGRPTGAPFLDQPGSFRAVVRFSRGAGVPDPLPDVLGLAIKVIDAHATGRDQDLLLVTSASPPVGRHLILPATGFLGRQFSSVLPYLVGRRVRVFGAAPVTPAQHDGGTALAEVHVAALTGELRFDLTMAGEVMDWHRIGELRVGPALGHEKAEALRFNPWHTGPGIVPLGLLQTLRASAYRGSQRHRV